MNNLNIAWLSDIHIGMADDKPNGLDVRRRFIAALEDIRTFKPELLVLGGDLCLDSGDPDTYKWVSDQISKHIADNCRVIAIPGNHDSADLMEAIPNCRFISAPLPRKETIEAPSGPIHYLLFDSSSGLLGDSQLSWLERMLKETADESADTYPALIFIHHPPVVAGVRYMDEHYPLRDRQEFADIVTRSGRRCWIFSGHYHCDVQTALGNSTVFVCPTTYSPIHPTESTHQRDNVPPGWRLISIDKQGMHSYPRFALT